LLLQKPAARLALAFLSGGLLIKAGFIPFHSWAIEVEQVAPAPVASMFAGVLRPVMGLYVLIRVGFVVFGQASPLPAVLLVFGLLSIIVGGYLSSREVRLQKLFTYSSISQLGYVAVGFGLATPLGLIAGYFYFFNLILVIPLLFLSAGSIFYALETNRLTKPGEPSPYMPITYFAFMGAHLVVAGILPGGIFFSKLLLLLAVFQENRYFTGLILILMSLFTLPTMIRSVRRAFSDESENRLFAIKKGGILIKLPLVLMVIFVFLTPILFFSPFRELIIEGVPGVLLDSLSYSLRSLIR
ncbi:MAG: hypothetical protein GX817_00350, partial [Elusimicrobia bacterium]|nr:hypothetical protein [Elusimicrobiota bacterium]